MSCRHAKDTDTIATALTTFLARFGIERNEEKHMVQQCKQNPLRSANTAATTKGTKDRLHCVGSVEVRTALLQNAAKVSRQGHQESAKHTPARLLRYIICLGFSFSTVTPPLATSTQRSKVELGGAQRTIGGERTEKCF